MYMKKTLTNAELADFDFFRDPFADLDVKPSTHALEVENDKTYVHSKLTLQVKDCSDPLRLEHAMKSIVRDFGAAGQLLYLRSCYMEGNDRGVIRWSFIESSVAA